MYPGTDFPAAVDQISNQPDREIPDAIMAIQRSLIGGGTAGTGLSTVTTTGAVSPGNGTTAGPAHWGGTGAPATGLGAVGDYYFRSDTPSTANQRIYVKTAAAVWTGIV